MAADARLGRQRNQGPLMTPIHKAIKALEQALWHIGSDEDPIHLVPEEVKWSTSREGAATLVRQALSDLSSLKLEDGDVEKVARLVDPDIWATRDHLASLDQPILAHVDRVCEPSIAKAQAILAFLGHGGEG